MGVLADRLKKVQGDKFKERAEKAVPMSEKRTNIILGNKSTSGVESPQHPRPLQPLLNQAGTMASNEHSIDTASNRQPNKSLSIGSAAKQEPVKLTLKERLEAKRKAAEAKAEFDAAPKREDLIAGALAQMEANEQKEEEKSSILFSDTGVYVTPPADGIDFYAKEEATSNEAEPEKELSPLERMRAKLKSKDTPKRPTVVKPEEGYAELEAATSKGKLPSAPAKAAPVMQKTGTTGNKNSLLNRLATAKQTSATVQSESAPVVSTSTTSKLSLKDRLAAAKKHEADKDVQHDVPHCSVKATVDAGKAVERTAEQQAVKLPEIVIEGDSPAATPVMKAEEKALGEADSRVVVPLNERQQAAVDRALEGQSFSLIGKAGTGKTTSVREILRSMRDSCKLSKGANFKMYGGGSNSVRKANQWRVACVAFTRTAANNIRDSICVDPDLEDFRWCCQTVHNLLEYQPAEEEVWDAELGDYVMKKRFVAMRDEHAKVDCDLLIVEEASMIDLQLLERLMRALPEHCQVIYLGDINQLPPVFGLPALAYALHKLPVVELTHVYRTAMGPVLSAAHNILEGKLPEEGETESGAFNLYHEADKGENKLIIKRHSRDNGTPISVGQGTCASLYGNLFKLFFDNDIYNPEQDVVLSPWNKRELGTVDFNAVLAQFIGDARNAVVYEVIAGYSKHYLAVGDRVVVQKQAGTILEIVGNGDYIGRTPLPASISLSRFGTPIIGRDSAEIDLDALGTADDYSNFDLDSMADKSADEMKRSASHVVKIELETGELVYLRSAGDFALDKFGLGYCITGHKSQGMEWRKVWIIAHQSQASTITREWLYTTVTRTKRECSILGHTQTIQKALARQRITGDTVEEKIENFTGAVTNLDEVRVLPMGDRVLLAGEEDGIIKEPASALV